MFNCFLHTLNKQSKFFKPCKLYEQRHYSILYSISHPSSTTYNRNKINPVKIYNPNKLSCRQFSVTEVNVFFQNFFQSIANSQASAVVQNSLIELHDISGLPWWGTIFVTTAALKLFLGLPIAAYQQFLVAKLKLTSIELESIIKDVREQVILAARRGKWTKQKANIRLATETKKHWNTLVVKNNCHPFKTVILTLTQLPVWVLLSVTLRKIALDVSSGTLGSIPTLLQFPVGGLFWCSNLTLPDVTLILPTIITVTSLSLIELNVLAGSNVMSLLSKIITNLLRILSIVSFFVSANVPSCVSLYWATSMLFGLATNLLLLSPKTRRFLKIPKTPSELERPYSHVYTKFVEKISKWSIRKKT